MKQLLLMMLAGCLVYWITPDPGVAFAALPPRALGICITTRGIELTCPKAP